MAESPVALNQDDVAVAGPLQVLPSERQGHGVDLDRHDQAPGPDDLPRQGRPVAGAHPNLEEPVPLPEPERLVEQGVAVGAGDRGLLAREGQRDLLVGVVPVRAGDEVLAAHDEHGSAEPLRAKEPGPGELRRLRFPLPPQLLLGLDRPARRRNRPAAHRPGRPGPRSLTRAAAFTSSVLSFPPNPDRTSADSLGVR